jgi:serine phosphatase RsbU (regulator of sigma subunit)
VYSKLSDYNKALEYQLQGLKMYKDINDKFYIITSYGILAPTYLKLKNYKVAKQYSDSALTYWKKTNYIAGIRDAELLAAQVDTSTGNYKDAFMHYQQYLIFRDKLKSEYIHKVGIREKFQNEYAKQKAVEKVEQDKKDAQQRIITWSILGGLFLVLVFAGFIFRSLRITRKQKQVIELKSKETEEQKKLVEEKNKDILDSITYAKRLQDAILPPLSLVKQHLPESFLLYKPKDIVAGDFYWMEKACDNILIAAADCTGHGVPGAMVSVVCSNALNRTVKEFRITEPGKILDKVRELVLETFEKSEDNVQDGMDISLCCITASLPSKGELNTVGSEISPLGSGGATVQWSGAYNSLWYIRKGEVIEVPADKQPIGKIDKPFPFNTHNLNLEKGDTLYLFTDGYADQFGGPKGKKFKYKQLEELLLMNSSKAMEEQKKILEVTLEGWKGGLEQVDDILVIGIRI